MWHLSDEEEQVLLIVQVEHPKELEPDEARTGKSG